MIFALLLAGWLLIFVLLCALCVAARRGEMDHSQLVGQALERQLWAEAEPEIAARSQAHRTVSGEPPALHFRAGNAAA